MIVRVRIQRHGNWEWRSVDIDLDEIVKDEIITQCRGISDVDIEKDGFNIAGIKASTLSYELY